MTRTKEHLSHLKYNNPDKSVMATYFSVGKQYFKVENIKSLKKSYKIE